MNIVKYNLIALLLICVCASFAGEKEKAKRKKERAEIIRIMQKRERALDKYGKKTSKKERAAIAKRKKINAECGKIMRDKMKKLNKRLDHHKKGIFTKKEKVDRKKQRKIQREVKIMMAARRKHLESDNLGKLSKKEKQQLRAALKRINNAKPEDYKTADKMAKENTNKFDGDIDIDPEDDWDEDPELFGD
jgi:hypothetical protein